MIVVKTEQGEVKISESVIARIIISTVQEMFRGKVYFSNLKGKRVRIGRTGKEKFGFIEVVQDGADDVKVHFYAVLRFGTSRSSIENDMFSAVCKNVKKYTNLEISEMIMTVTGILSKNQVAKRVFDIEMQRGF